jgi:hypothetical protein
MQNLEKNTRSGTSLTLISNQPAGKWLFYRLAAIYSQKFTSFITDATAQALVENEWNIGLQGLTAEQIQHGVDRARAESDWPPSISEFINLCLDIPSLGEFMNGHPVLEKIAMNASGKTTFDLTHMTARETAAWKKDAYPVAVKWLRNQRLGQ